MLRWHVCRVNFARKIFFEPRIFLRKMLRNFPRKFWAFVLWVRKKSPENSLQISHLIFQISLRKIKKKFTDELLQERREKTMVSFSQSQYQLQILRGRWVGALEGLACMEVLCKPMVERRQPHALKFTHLVAPYCAIPRDYLSDTPLLRAMGFLVSQHSQKGAIPPPPFLSVFPLGEHAKWGCDTPPPPKGYLSDTRAIPYENKANGCDTPLCDTISELESEGYCAIWGAISHWAAKFTHRVTAVKSGSRHRGRPTHTREAR